MARYIDADALMEELNSLSITVTGFRGGKCYWSKIVEEYKDTVLRIISEQATADVVPKSEYDDLQSMLDAAIAGQETLQKALAEAKSNNEIRGESFYFELEKFEERGKQLVRVHDAEVVKDFAERLKAGLIEGGIYPVLVKNQIEKVVKDMTGEAYTLGSLEYLRNLSGSERDVYLLGEWGKDGND